MATQTQSQEQNKSALKPIIFYQGEENGIVVETNNYEYSIFYDQYKSAAANFGRIWNHQHSKQDKNKQGRDDAQYMLDNKFSNIIAFCGDRGEGKSSCMSSFAKIISEEKSYNAASKAHIFENISFSSYDKIELVDPIDPAFFDKKHNVLELLLGRMYQRVKKHYIQKEESNTPDQKLYDYKELLNQFQKVNKCLSILDKDDKLYDSLEEVADLAAGIQLKEEIDKLFSLYLKFFGKEDGRIVICLDDIDLNMTEAHKMAECVRKYLINLHCIILVAVNVEQLVEVIASSMAKDMDGANESNDIEEVRRKRSFYMSMAHKYVAKLLPQGNRVFMPNPQDLGERAIFEDLSVKDVETLTKEKIIKQVPLKEYIVRLIFKKTGYVFYNTQYLSPIIPNNLRDLRHFISMLNGISTDAEEWIMDEKIDHEEGREVFREYFYHSWTSRLDIIDRQFIATLENYDDLTTLNKYVVEHFASRVEHFKIFEGEDVSAQNYKLYKRITQNNNVAANVSFGDVMYMLWFVDKITTSTLMKDLIFWLRSFYSMKLYECYNKITVGADTVYPKLKDDDVTIHKSDRLYEHVNAMQRLINGSFFTYVPASLLPTNKQTNLSRDRKVVAMSGIKLLFDKLREFIVDKKTAITNWPLNETETLNLCEYIALCIFRTTNVDEKFEDKYANLKSSIPTYLGPISSTASYAIFDFLQPFTTLCNIQYAYERLNDIFNAEQKSIDGSKEPFTLYTVALSKKDSLLSQLFKNVRFNDKKRKSTNKELKAWVPQHLLLSDAVIRIADIQWAILDSLLSNHKVNKEGGDAKNIQVAYEVIRSLGITLYPIQVDETARDNKQKGWSIKFEFLSSLEEVIKNRDDILMNWVLVNEGSFDLQKAIGLYLSWQLRIKYPCSGGEIASKISKYRGQTKEERTQYTRILNKALGKSTQYTSLNEVMRVIVDKLPETAPILGWI